MAAARRSLVPDFLARHEGWLALLFAALLFAGNLATTTIFPAFGSDEELLSDAGVNLALGHGYVSTGWRGQSKEEFFGGNLPLHPLAVAGWIKLFGFGFYQMRALPIFLGALAALGLWCSIRRLGWLQNAWARLLLLPVAFGARPVFTACRIDRYDALQIFLCVALLVVLALRLRPWAERCALAAVAVLVTAAGFQSAVYVGLWCLLACAWDWRRCWRRAAAVCAGLGVSALGLLYWMQSEQILHGLIDNIAYGKAIDGGTPVLVWKMRLHRVFIDTLFDESLVLLLVAIFLMASQPGLCAIVPAIARLVRCALVATAAITVGVEAAIHFPYYYRWMTLLPAAVIAVLVLEKAAPHLTPGRRGLAVLALSAVALFGALRSLGQGLIIGNATQRLELASLVAREIRPDDVVLTDFPGYCFVKPRAALTYSPGYVERMTPAEKDSLTAILAVENQIGRFGDFATYLSTPTRRWVKVAEVPHYREGLYGFLARKYPAQVDRQERAGYNYRLALYRPEPAAP